MFTLLPLPKLAPAVIIASLGLGAGAATTVAAGLTEMPLTCGVTVTDLGDGVEMQATLASDQQASGIYELTVNKTGPGGSAKISQGGMFSLEAGETTVLGETVLGGDSGQYDIDLILRWNGLRLRCPIQDI